MRYGTEGDDKESNELLHGEFLTPLRRSEQAWEPYAQESPLCWRSEPRKPGFRINTHSQQIVIAGIRLRSAV